MQKLTKKAWIEIGITSGIFVALMIVAAFADLAINIALYNPTSLYGQFFDNLGELPTYLTAPVVGTILFHQTYTKGSKTKILCKILSVIIVFAGFLLAIKMWFWGNFVSDEILYSWVYCSYFAALLTICCILGTSKVDKELMSKLLIFAIFLLIVMALTTVIIQVLKYVWARQRFRTMTSENPLNEATLLAYGSNFEGFTPWYLPQTIFRLDLRTDEYMEALKTLDDDAFKSFPSGHTGAAAASFGLILLPDMFEKLNTKKLRWVFWAVPIAYTTLVGVSRIVMGAHYLSDIVVGGFIGFGIATLARYIIMSKGWHTKEISLLSKN